MSGCVGADRLGGVDAFVVPVGGIRMSVRTASGAELLDGGEQLVEVGWPCRRARPRRSSRAAPLSPLARGSYPPRTPRASCADGTRAARQDGEASVSIRVVLGEDNVLVREGVRALLDSYDDIEVVGVAEDAPVAAVGRGRARARRRRHRHQDAAERSSSRASTARTRSASSIPDTGVVVLSAHDDEEYAIALLGRGHSGLAYLLKDRIAQGDELVARDPRGRTRAAAWSTRSIAERLSGRSDAAERDRELLDMMAKGLGYEEIADRARHDAGGRRPAGDRAVPRDGRDGDGGSSAGRRVQAAARRGRRADRVRGKTLASFVPSAARRPARRASRDRDRAPGGRGDRAVQRHPRVLDDRRTARGARRRRGRGSAPRRRWPRSSSRTAARSTSSRATP